MKLIINEMRTIIKLIGKIKESKNRVPKVCNKEIIEFMIL
jgi:hypothetical protein